MDHETYGQSICLAMAGGGVLCKQKDPSERLGEEHKPARNRPRSQRKQREWRIAKTVAMIDYTSTSYVISPTGFDV